MREKREFYMIVYSEKKMEKWIKLCIHERHRLSLTYFSYCVQSDLFLCFYLFLAKIFIIYLIILSRLEIQGHSSMSSAQILGDSQQFHLSSIGVHCLFIVSLTRSDHLPIGEIGQITGKLRAVVWKENALLLSYMEISYLVVLCFSDNWDLNPNRIYKTSERQEHSP